MFKCNKSIIDGDQLYLRTKFKHFSLRPVDIYNLATKPHVYIRRFKHKNTISFTDRLIRVHNNA